MSAEKKKKIAKSSKSNVKIKKKVVAKKKLKVKSKTVKILKKKPLKSKFKEKKDLKKKNAKKGKKRNSNLRKKNEKVSVEKNFSKKERKVKTDKRVVKQGEEKVDVKKQVVKNERIEIKNLKEAMELVVEFNFKEIYKLFNRDFGKISIVGIYSSKEEVFEELKSNIYDRLREEYRDIRSKFSELRKKGEDVDLEECRFFLFESKLRVFEVYFDEKSYSDIVCIFDKARSFLKKFKFD